jgi:hypothetical protein
MKLRQILEGHWTLAPGEYPNSMVKSIPDKPERHSPLLHPSDREKFIKWGQRKKKKIAEDVDDYAGLEDADEFEEKEEVTFYIVEVPTEYHYRWADNQNQGEYPGNADEYGEENPAWVIDELKERVNKLKKSLWEAQVTIDDLTAKIQ